MIQILPPKTNLGAEIGQGLGQGLSKGIQRGAEVGFQRNLLQDSLKNLNIPEGASPFDLAKGLISATAGIPGAERYVGQLFPLLLQQMRGQATKGQNPVGTNNQNPQADQEKGQFPDRGGYLAPPMTQQEKLQFAENYGLGSPDDKSRGLDIANKLSEGQENNLNQFQNRAKALGVKESELPYFTQIAQGKNVKNPEELFKQSLRDLDEVRALDNALVPGITRGGFEKATENLGLVPSFLRGDTARQKAIKNLQPTVQNLIKKGYEPIVRSKLAALDLGPTEIEQVIHPLSGEMKAKLDSFPKPSKNPETRNSMLKNLLKSSINKDSSNKDASLLVLRDNLVNKGYNWEDLVQAYQGVQNELPLTPSQQAELPEFTTQPPRDSLMNIFSEWGRSFDYIRGKK